MIGSGGQRAEKDRERTGRGQRAEQDRERIESREQGVQQVEAVEQYLSPRFPSVPSKIDPEDLPSTSRPGIA